MTILKSSISEFGIDGEVLAKFPTVDSFSKDRAVFVVPGEQTEGDFAKVIEGFGAAQKNISVALTLNNRSQKFNFSAKGSTKAVSTLNQRCSK